LQVKSIESYRLHLTGQPNCPISECFLSLPEDHLHIKIQNSSNLLRLWYLLDHGILCDYLLTLGHIRYQVNLVRESKIHFTFSEMYYL
jgi:hypothetical protein